jgi:hypothetical protein
MRMCFVTVQRDPLHTGKDQDQRNTEEDSIHSRHATKPATGCQDKYRHLHCLPIAVRTAFTLILRDPLHEVVGLQWLLCLNKKSFSSSPA